MLVKQCSFVFVCASHRQQTRGWPVPHSTFGFKHHLFGPKVSFPGCDAGGGGTRTLQFGMPLASNFPKREAAGKGVVFALQGWSMVFSSTIWLDQRGKGCFCFFKQLFGHGYAREMINFGQPSACWGKIMAFLLPDSPTQS